jgi:hypothetical protein
VPRKHKKVKKSSVFGLKFGRSSFSGDFSFGVSFPAVRLYVRYAEEGGT